MYRVGPTCWKGSLVLGERDLVKINKRPKEVVGEVSQRLGIEKGKKEV